MVPSGDIFTRLRYFANNRDNKEFDLDSIFYLMKDVILFIRIIHEMGNDLDFDPVIGYAKTLLKLHPEYLSKSKEDIEKLFNMDFSDIEEKGLLLELLLFSTKEYTLEELNIILSDKRITENDYGTLISNNIHYDLYNYFYDLGIKDSYEMYLIGRGYNIFNPITMFNFKMYTFDEIKSISEYIENDKYNNLTLLSKFNPSVIKKINKHKNILNFLRDNIDTLVNFYDTPKFKITEDFFLKLIDLRELNDVPEAFYSMDNDQVTIYRNISKLIYEKTGFEEAYNPSNFYNDTIIDHVKENIDFFKDNKKLLRKIPVFLDLSDNIAILDTLIENGLDLENIDNLDSTIFSIPLNVFNMIISIMKDMNEPIIINNNINIEFFKLLKCALDIVDNSYNNDYTNRRKLYKEEAERLNLVK